MLIGLARDVIGFQESHTRPDEKFFFNASSDRFEWGKAHDLSKALNVYTDLVHANPRAKLDVAVCQIHQVLITDVRCISIFW